MTDKEKFQSLLKDFSIVSEEEWRKKAEKEAGAEMFLKKRYIEDIALHPIYTDYTNKNSEKSTFAHFNRTSLPDSEFSNLYVDIVPCEKEKTANKTALDSLKGGADGILFHLKKPFTDFDVLLDEIWIDNAVVAFNLGSDSLSSFFDFFDYFEKKGFNYKMLRGWIGYDFLKESPLLTSFPGDYLNVLLRFYKNEKEFPYFNPIVINSHLFFNSGANIAQEIAYTLSLAIEHIHALAEKGITPEKTITGILFSLTVGTNYFFEISKLKAFRHLWSKIAGAYNTIISPEEIKIHSQTSLWYKSNIDKENNIIRDSAELMAAIIGGANYVSVRNADSVAGQSVTSKRISRNIAHILKEESFLTKVADPSAGSYYIENLSYEIAEKSWQLFLEIEKNGGFFKAMEKGIINKSIEESKNEKLRAYELRDRSLIGVNVYPNFEDKLEVNNSGEEMESVLQERNASKDFELLRQTMEFNVKKNNSQRPKALVCHFNANNERSSLDLIKNAFNSAGYAVEFIKDLFIQSEESMEILPFASILILFVHSEEEIIRGKNKIKEFRRAIPVVFTSSQKLENYQDNDYYPMIKLIENKTILSILNNSI